MKAGQFTHELSGQMEDAASATTRAYANLKRQRNIEVGADANGGTTAQASEAVEEVSRDKKKEQENGLQPEVAIVQPIFRFFQLLCENHNLELQVANPLVLIITSVGMTCNLADIVIHSTESKSIYFDYISKWICFVSSHWLPDIHTSWLFIDRV
jgi:hypothetical protein